MIDEIDGQSLAGGNNTFSKLLKKRVRVVFRENPADGEKGSTCWIGELVRDGGDFIELLSGHGTPSFINKQFIIAISEMRDGAW